MPNKHIYISYLLAVVLLGSCASRKVLSANYYFQHEGTIDTMAQSYKAIYAQQPFSVEFTDKSFNFISIEIITDSLKYIYEFNLNEPRLQDTLSKYNLPTANLINLIQQMRSIRCTWINNLDYYSAGQKSYLVFMSMRPVAVQLPITNENYFILTFYNQPQYFDSEGRLLASKRQKRLRKIDGEIFHRINDKVCYTISERFR